MRTESGKNRHGFSKSNFQISFALILIFLFSNAVCPQKLPDKIRGYKVFKQEIVITDLPESKTGGRNFDARINLDKPELTDVSISGIKFEIGGEVTVYGQSGTVDFISFKDFEVNGIKVEVAEYTQSFDFTKNDPFILKKPVEMNISAEQTLRAAWKEIKNSEDEWLVTGRVFVFGKFRKFGFNFKRVVPVEIKIKIPNPLKSEDENESRQSN